jgi:hypothetical protein
MIALANLLNVKKENEMEREKEREGEKVTSTFGA